MNRTNGIKNESGYILVGVVVLAGLSMLVMTAMLESTASAAKSQAVVNTFNSRFYDVEQNIGKATAWLQDNSKNFVTLFETTQFNSEFNFSSPSTGDNEATYFGVPTMVKVAGTSNDSALITNNSNFGVSNFPTTTHIDTGATFDPVSEFQAAFPDADAGGVNLRIILLWARQAGSDFSPIFRIDAITGNNPDRGVHVFSHVYGTFVSTGATDAGFYGQNFVSFNGNSWCKSKIFDNSSGSWVAASESNNCQIQSQGNMSLSGSGLKIHGAAMTNTENGVSDPSKVTDNNSAGCATPGCHTTTLVLASDHGGIVRDWNLNCPTGGVDFTGDNNSLDANSGTLSADGNNNCYDTITINNNKSLTLTSFDKPYYVRHFDFGNPQSKILFGLGAPSADEHIELFVGTANNNHFNGNRIFNKTYAPHSVKIYYTSSTGLTLNGTVDMRSHIYAPFTTVTLNGNFEYYGKINALAIDVIGTADLFSDEISASSSVTADVNFAVNKISQRFN